MESLDQVRAIKLPAGDTVTLTNIRGGWEPGATLYCDVVYPDAVSATNALLSSGPPSLSPTSDPWPDGSAQWDDAVWEVATDENFTQNVQTQTLAISGTGTQTGPTFTLDASTGYYVRVRYQALGSKSNWSSSVYFITAA
jgi:hypothetical protein